jgi:hypothetical protein
MAALLSMYDKITGGRSTEFHQYFLTLVLTIQSQGVPLFYQHLLKINLELQETLRDST